MKSKGSAGRTSSRLAVLVSDTSHWISGWWCWHRIAVLSTVGDKWYDHTSINDLHVHSSALFCTLLYYPALSYTPPLLLDYDIAVSHNSHAQLGNKDEALSNYIASLHVYEAVSGKKSPSYISTLANLGELFMCCRLSDLVGLILTTTA